MKIMAATRAKLIGETHSGSQVSFSHEAFQSAMNTYDVKYLEGFVQKVERSRGLVGRAASSLMQKLGYQWPAKPETIDFFRDFLIIQETDHPDYDRAIALGSLATRLELATGQTSGEELTKRGIDTEPGRREYELIFG